MPSEACITHIVTAGHLLQQCMLVDKLCSDCHYQKAFLQHQMMHIPSCWDVHHVAPNAVLLRCVCRSSALAVHAWLLNTGL